MTFVRKNLGTVKNGDIGFPLGVGERQLLLMFIDILESSKDEGEARLRELEIAAERVFK